MTTALLVDLYAALFGPRECFVHHPRGIELIGALADRLEDRLELLGVTWR